MDKERISEIGFPFLTGLTGYCDSLYISLPKRNVRSFFLSYLLLIEGKQTFVVSGNGGHRHSWKELPEIVTQLQRPATSPAATYGHLYAYWVFSSLIYLF